MTKQYCGIPWLPGICDLTFDQTRKFIFLMLLVFSSFVDGKLKNCVCVYELSVFSRNREWSTREPFATSSEYES